MPPIAAPQIIRIITAAVAGVALCVLIIKERDWTDFIRLLYVLSVLSFYFVRRWFYPGAEILNQMATFIGIHANIVILAYVATELIQKGRAH